jgi:hypothetical protein
MEDFAGGKHTLMGTRKSSSDAITKTLSKLKLKPEPSHPEKRLIKCLSHADLKN